MKDYRLPENRQEYFANLYFMNLENKVMPGLVYLYLPELAKRLRWDNEQKLWFAALNSFTQNPITTLRIFQQLPVCPPAGAELSRFSGWFDENWETLQFDTDRVKNKRNTILGIKSYANLAAQHGGLVSLFSNKTYKQLWELKSQIYSLGRLSTFSGLEYIYIMGFGADCDNLMFEDKSGSKSHRNGMFLFMGRDDLVWDKRLDNGQDGNYENFSKMCSYLDGVAADRIARYRAARPDLPNIGNFTLESNLCTFKNHFFARRYPGVYADMAMERIDWYDSRGLSEFTKVFKEIREDGLPEWLRIECQTKPIPRSERAAIFADTGFPYRGSFFLDNNEV